MATGTTTTLDLIIPDVWADTLAPIILGKSVMIQFATTDDDLVGQPGDTVIFPKWAYIGDADDLTENVAMDVTKMSMVDSRATIKEVGKAVALTDSATLAAIGKPDAEAQRQLALSVARKIDTDLRKAAEEEHTNGGVDDPEPTSAPLKLAVSGKLTWNVLTQAFALMGDDYDPSELAGIVVHSSQHQQLLNDPNFLSADKFGAGAVIQRGQIGAIGTVPLFVSDRATAVADVDSGTAGNQPGVKALVLAKGALALKYKRRPIVEKDRDILARKNVVTTNAHYAAKRVNDRGVIVVTTSSALTVS